MSYSIVARSGEAYGVAVAGRVLAVGTLAAAARPGVGAVCVLASPTTTREALLWALETGTDPQDALDGITADPAAASGQLALVGRHRAAARTGERLGEVAGQRVGGDEHTGYAIIGHYLASEEVLDAVERTFVESPHLPFVERLVASLAAGDAAGGDVRGRQSASVLAVEEGAGIDGGALLADLRVDDHEHPVAELARLARLSDLAYGPRRQVMPLEGPLRTEVVERLGRLGIDVGPVTAAPAALPADEPAVGEEPRDPGAEVTDEQLQQALAAWAVPANLRRRLDPTGIDVRLLQVLREATVVHPGDHSEAFPGL